ncbi:MAG: tRNA (adenosine(37)-N6)-threonylcarbamoyltransferase complex ATPase subunit type 1 TsaE, partial [Pseudomonadota bacterium]
MEIWEETIDLPNELATGELARQIASVAWQSDVIALVGALGAGKTTFSRAFINSIYARFELPPPDVQSPTFG